MMQRKLAFLCMLLLSAFSLKAQNSKDKYSPKSGHKFSQIGDNLINVDLFTGTGSANIPIYDYSIDGLSFNVALQYNAKGIQVDQLSSSVGLGWELFAGGRIVRNVRDVEDEVTTPARFSVPPGYLGYTPWGYYPGCDSNCYNQYDTLTGSLVPGAINPNNPPVDSNHFPVFDDVESDVFLVQLGGRSFSICFKKSGNSYSVVTYPKTDCTVEVVTKDLVNGVYTNVRSGFQKNTGLDSTHNIVTFNIRDEHGNTFYFERGDYQAKKLDLPPDIFANPTDIYYPTETWNLDHVITYTGREVKFYYAKKYVAYAEGIQEILHGYTNSYVASTHIDPLQIKKNDWTGYKTHVSKIEYPNGSTIEFGLSTSATQGRCDCEGNFRLYSISVSSQYDNNYKNTITYKLLQAYFNTPKFGVNNTEINLGFSCANIGASLDLNAYIGLTTAQKDSIRQEHLDRGLRLKLTGIDKVGTDGVTTEPQYRFTYNATPLPYRLDAQKDYFGYYGTSVTPYIRFNPWVSYEDDTFWLSIPYHHGISSVWDAGSANPYWGADRNFNFTNAQADILTKITNGSGGDDSIIYSNYHLENPTCSYGNLVIYGLGCYIDPEVWGDTVNDGLVVGKVISRNHISSESDVVTEYNYMGGQRFYRGGYFKYKEPLSPYTDSSVTNFFIDRHDYFHGSNHGFDTVIVSRYGFNNERLSKTQYHFSNLMYETVNGTASNMKKPTGPIFHSISADFKKYRLGLPLSIIEFDENDYVMSKHETEYEYRDGNDSILNFSRIFNPGLNPIYECWVCYPLWNFNVIDHEMLLPSTSTNTSYVYDPLTHQADSMEIVKLYKFDEHNNPSSIYWQDSKGDTYAKHLLYNYDYGHVASSITAMNQDALEHLLSQETWKIIPVFPYHDSVLISYQLDAPDYSGGILRFPAKFETVIKDNPLTSSSVFPSQGTSLTVDRTAALNYSSNLVFGSNLEEVTKVTRYDNTGNASELLYTGRNMYETSIWDNHLNNKVASVSNARYSDVAYTSFDGSYAGTGVADDNKGNWWFDNSHILLTPVQVCSTAITGKYVYELTQNNDHDSVYLKSHSLGNQDYIISWWSYHPNAGAIVEARLYNGTTNLGAIPTTIVNTVGNWSLHVGSFTAASGNYVQLKNFSGTTGGHTAYIDEVRLYPRGAAMTTYTYKPLFGVGSVCDPYNEILYFEYDAMGRQRVVRDMHGNIRSKTETVVNGPDPVTYGSGSNSNNSTY